MQLGELQNQIERFERRGVSIVALSVDQPTDSIAMIERLGLTFPLGSDPQQTVVSAFGVQNPDTRELALHAVYVVDANGEIIYRKVARRRPTSNELIDAIDAHRGTYPETDNRAPASRVAVAYPENNFQGLLEIAAAQRLPPTVDESAAAETLQLIREGRSDDALIAYRQLMAASQTAGLDELLLTAAWMARQTFFPSPHAALTAAQTLRARLDDVRRLNQALQSAATDDDRDQTLQQLARARALLERSRADIATHADAWRLRRVKTMIRSYREVALASRRGPAR